MLKKYYKIFLVPLFLSILFLPHSASAVDWFPLVPCGLNQQPANATRKDTLPDGTQVPHDYTQDCNQCLLVELGKNAIDMTFFAIVPSVGTLLFLWAGFMILFNARTGSPGGVAAGTKIMTATAIGIAIILGSWLITNFILKSLANDQVAKTPWYTIECRVGTLKDLTDVTIPHVGTNTDNPSDPTGVVPGGSDNPGNGGTKDLPKGSCTGAMCSDSKLNVCAADTSANCYESEINKWDAQIKAAANGNQIGSGIDTVALLKAIMSQESGGRTNLDASDGLSYGIFQMRPETANTKKSGCTTDTITPSWLKDSTNVQASACIAINFLKSLIGSCGTSVRNLAAGYNGGGAEKGACQASTSCASCSVCGTEKTMRWECPWDGADGAHQSCNVDRTAGSFNATRKYAPKVAYCYNKFGGTVSGGGRDNTNVVAAPAISSMTPLSAMAGTEASFDQSTGVNTFTYMNVPFEIKGQNLNGATVSADNVGVDGNPGIEFKDLKYTATSISGNMLMHSTAKDGASNITVKNSKGAAQTKLDVKITGTQHLARKFANSPNVKFFGRWPGVMPDSSANKTADLVSQGLSYLNKDSYKKLNIITQVYEPQFWTSTGEQKYCSGDTQRSFKAAGCARPSDPIIYIKAEQADVPRVIFHEAAHKLHFYLLGEYKPAPSQASDFQKKWQAVTDPNVRQCAYLPSKIVNGRVLWSDGLADQEFTARCSMIWSYGGLGVDRDSSTNGYYEDVATMAESKIDTFLDIKSGDGATNPAPYQQKNNLLNQYGF
jgi:hypothetical protein